MIKLILAYLFAFMLITTSCTKSDNPGTGMVSGAEESWLVPPDKVLFQDLPKDRIKSIDHPVFIPVSESNIGPDELVLAVHIGSETKIYPVAVMDTHEIVNDKAGSYYYSITYCPLTGSGMLWNREINGKVTEFGVSGMLYNENLMPYDRNTESIWSQMKMQCVNGSLIGITPETKALLEVKFSTIKEAFPEALVLDQTSCDSGDCGGLEQVGSLRDEPADGEHNVSLPSDQQYFGIVKNDRLLLFNFRLFEEDIQIYTTNFQGSSLIVCGSYDLHFYTAFIDNASFKNYKYSPVQNGLPVIMKDDQGNRYDLFGEVVEGPDKGKHLETAIAYVARPFAWALFFNDIKLFNE